MAVWRLSVLSFLLSFPLFSLKPFVYILVLIFTWFLSLRSLLCPHVRFLLRLVFSIDFSFFPPPPFSFFCRLFLLTYFSSSSFGPLTFHNLPLKFLPFFDFLLTSLFSFVWFNFFFYFTFLLLLHVQFLPFTAFLHFISCFTFFLALSFFTFFLLLTDTYFCHFFSLTSNLSFSSFNLSLHNLPITYSLFISFSFFSFSSFLPLTSFHFMPFSSKFLLLLSLTFIHFFYLINFWHLCRYI